MTVPEPPPAAIHEPLDAKHPLVIFMPFAKVLDAVVLVAVKYEPMI